jgi:hypothetical protein
MSTRIFYRTPAGTTAVSLDELLEGRLIVPNGRILPVGPPWEEVEGEDFQLTEPQAEVIGVLEAKLAELARAEERAEFDQTAWKTFVDGLIDPLNKRVRPNLVWVN